MFVTIGVPRTDETIHLCCEATSLEMADVRILFCVATFHRYPNLYDSLYILLNSLCTGVQHK